jgi:hypothetical protein
LGRAVLLTACLAAVALAGAGDAAALATGPLAVHVEGTVGEPVVVGPPATIWNVHAVDSLSGILGGSNEVDGTIIAFEEGTPRRPIVVGPIWGDDAEVPGGGTAAVVFACVVTTFDESGAPSAGSCTVRGAAVGLGTFQVRAMQLEVGGEVSVDVDFPRVLCVPCAT